MLTRLWSLLRALFRRPAPTRREIPAEPEPPPSPAAPVEPAVPAIDSSPEVALPAPEPSAQPLGEPSEDEDEDEWAGEEAEEEPDDEPDPFITGTAAAAEAVSVDIQALRAQARAEALSGEHRIYLSSPAGPGSLAEALNLLLEEGLVEAQFVQVGDDAPYILYRPIA